MKTPRFWKSKNLISTTLLPLGWIYSGLTAARLKFKKSGKVNIPVICLGNITAGGSGKTPTAVTLAKLLQKKGYHPYFVSRGYGGKLSGIILTKDSSYTAAEVGDEPLVLSRIAPVSINPDRYQAALKAQEQGADIIIMDDGFQNPSLKKDISILIIDGGFGFGNQRPLPAGPLRENLQNGLKRANAALIIGEDKNNCAQEMKNLPLFHGKIKEIEPQTKPTQVIAFAGIGRPEKFYQSLENCGMNIISRHDFPDHHFYTEKELQSLLHEAQEKKAALYTTAKDIVKIPLPLRPKFNVLEIEIEIEKEQELMSFILSRL